MIKSLFVVGSDVEVEIPEWIGLILHSDEDLLKGAGHKYIRRVPTGNPKKPWRYFYKVSGGSGLGHHSEFIEGAAFKVAHNGKEGHFHILSVDGDKLRIKHDESGEESTLTKDALTSLLHKEHAQAIGVHKERLKQELVAVSKHGTAKQKAKIKAEAEKAGVSDELESKKVSGDPAARVHVKFTPGDGLLIFKTTKQDGDAVKAAAPDARWSPTLQAWYVPKSQDWSSADYRGSRVHEIAERLSSSGVPARATEIRSLLGAEDRQAKQQERAEIRRDRLRDAADRAAQAARAAISTVKTKMGRVDLEQPIQVGHHSEAAHRRAINQIQSGLQRASDLENRAAALSSAADNAEAKMTDSRSAATVENKIKEISAEIRKLDKAGKLSDLGSLRKKELEDQLAYNEKRLAELDAANPPMDTKKLVPGSVVMTGSGPGMVVSSGKAGAKILHLRKVTTKIAGSDTATYTGREILPIPADMAAELAKHPNVQQGVTTSHKDDMAKRGVSKQRAELETALFNKASDKGRGELWSYGPDQGAHIRISPHGVDMKYLKISDMTDDEIRDLTKKLGG